MFFNCEICGSKKYIQPSHYKRVNFHFCSIKCRGIAQTGDKNHRWKNNQIKCLECGLLFKPKSKETKFCSRICMGAYDHNKNTVIKNCVICGKTFNVINAREKASCCSKDCARKLHSDKMFGSGNSNWLNGLSFGKYSEEFNKKIKHKIKLRDNFACRLCGLGDEDNFSGNGFGLSIHHIDYDKNNNLENNLISLCNRCHAKTNYNREQWKQKLLKMLEK